MGRLLRATLVAGFLVPSVVVGGAHAAARPAVTAALQTPADSLRPGGTIDALPWRRLLDSQHPVAQSTVHVLGRDGVPTSGVAAAIVHLVAVAPDKRGQLCATPVPKRRVTGAALSWAAHRTSGATAIVPLSSAGDMYLRSSTPVRVTVTIEGYVTTAAAAGTHGLFTATGHRAAFDSRTTNRLRHGAVRQLNLGAIVPAGASAALLSVAILSPTRGGRVSVGVPGAASAVVDAQRGQSSADEVLARIPASRRLRLTNDAGSDNVVVDVVGYLSADPGGGYFTPTDDTHAFADNLTGTVRYSPPSIAERVAGECPKVPSCRDLAPVPAMRSLAPPTAVVTDLTSVASDQPGFGAARSPREKRASTGDVYFDPAGRATGLTVAAPGKAGQIRLDYNFAHARRDRPWPVLTGDVVGYFSAEPDDPTAPGLWDSTASDVGADGPADRVSSRTPITAITDNDAGELAVLVQGTAYGTANGPDTGSPLRPIPDAPTGLVALASIGDTENHVALALDSTGTVWTWSWSDAAAQVGGLPPIVALGSGVEVADAVDTTGHVWVWGDDRFGEFGDGISTSGWQPTPRQIQGLSDIRSVVSGAGQSAAVDASGRIWEWGELGSGPVTTPHVVATTCGGQPGTLPDGVWYDPGFELCPDGTVVDFRNPSNVHMLTGVPAAQAISPSFYYPQILAGDGTVWRADDSGNYVQTLGLTGIRAIASGDDVFYAAR